MSDRPETPLLDTVETPADIRKLDKEQLRQLADELRDETISAVSVTGGHLGAGLGVVELTVAIHYVFDTPRDRLVWDVGHQCYPHKIVTGRRDRIRTLRMGDGLSGFTKRSESEYDPFGAAHSSTSISAALGFAVANKLSDAPGKAIAVIGDGAMSAGMAYEAMNNAGVAGNRLVVILNDNDMSIAPPVGGLSHYLARLVSSGKYLTLRRVAQKVARKLPKRLHVMARRWEEYSRGFWTGGTLFEELGFYYVGPVDGHNVERLVKILENVRDAEEGPMLVHVVTKKGKGYAPAEAAADKYHGVVKFDVVTGKQDKGPGGGPPAYQNVFGETLAKLAETDLKICAITAAMPSGTGVDRFAAAHPDRAFDVGIAEQHAVTFAAGLAAQGMRPFCAIYSTFLQRAYDQVVHDVAIQNLPVRFAIDRAGLVGADGATHAGSFDVTYLATLPNFVVMAAADEAELVHMVYTMAEHDSGPIAVRYPRGNGTGVALPETPERLEIGKGRIVREGKKVAILSLGTRLAEALKAADVLESKGLSATVADLRFAKPLDEELIRRLLTTHEVAVTVEEAAIGGLGAHVLTLASDAGLIDTGLKLRTMRLPDRFQDQEKPEKQYAEAGLDAEAIVDTVLKALRHNSAGVVEGAPGLKARADQLLVDRGLAESRSKAQAQILAGLVFSGERKIEKAGQALVGDAPLEVRGKDHPWVSRGGIKLAHALAHFGWDVAEAVALDVGSSTGGFTDVLLQKGAAKVFAVDVGTNQLAWKLRQDPRVAVHEQVNARYLTDAIVSEPVDIIVCDASFIGLPKVLDKALDFAKPGGRLIALVKPQFEAERSEIGKGGVVRDAVVHARVCAAAAAWLESRGWTVEGLTQSPITGPEGNVEFLLAARNGSSLATI